ncbi:protein PFC0760c-like isoform X1 [Myzus persicae]|uniref:protein PFC0760c-like isoform X1 n=1 Tax=Myzus persicae TaxID=13164 RepID=UPI000B934E5B|nr:protein PFC0760c-like isoform X1 [Myzus persicae]XP_022172523.1 protein PFC0760c-like isoform X1 [Myzus persicae]
MSSPNKQPVVEAIISVFETTQNQSWSMFSEKLNNVSNENSKKKPPAKSENTITLSSDDIPVFGLVPRLDKVMLVSCNECAMIVKRDCIHSHFYRRHNSSNASHSEADKFSLVNFLCTVKTNKNKKLKMTVRKTSEKKINDCEKVNSVVNEIKTEFDQEEYERLLVINRAKIKQESTTEYVDHQDVDMATPSCDPSTSSGVSDWDIKPCIQSLALDQCTDHKVDDKTMEHDKYSNKLSSESLCNKEDLQTNKYLNTQNIEHSVNNVTNSSELLKSDPIEKMKPKLTIDFSGFMHSDNKKYFKKHYKYKKKYKKCQHKIESIKETTKILLTNEYSGIINNTNYEDISTFYNQSSNTSAVDVKIEYYKLFSGLQNDCEDTKLFSHYEDLDIKIETPIDSGDSAACYHHSPESPKIKEEFQITPNNMYPDVKIKEEYDENNDKCKVEFYQPPTEFTKCSSDNNHSEVLSSKYSGNVDCNLSSISPCSVASIKEETTFMESSENIMINKSSGDTVISNNQSSIPLLDIKEESKYLLTTDFLNEESKPSLTTDHINEVSKPSLITVHTNEESKPSSNVDFINEKSKYPLITDYITDNSYTEYYQLYTDSVPQLSPSYKYLDDEINLQIEKDLNDQLNMQSENNSKVEDDLNDELNFSGEDHLIDKLILQIENRLSDKINLQVKGDLNKELNLHVDKNLNDKINFQAEEELIDEIELPTEDDDDTDWQSVRDEHNFQDEEDLNVDLNLQDEDDSSIELDDQDEDDVSDELSLQSEDNLDNGLHFQAEEDLNVELQLQSEDSLSDVENLSNDEDLGNVEDMSYGGDLNDEENFSDKENLGSDDIGTNNNLKYDCLVPSQSQDNEEETKHIPSKECSVIINNENSNVAFTDHDQSPTETLGNEEESKAKSQTDDTYVVIDNDGIINNFENEYYQYDHEPQTSFTPNYKYSDVISNDSSDSSNESLSSYDQSSVESLDVGDKIDYSSTDTSSDSTSDESLYDSESTTSSSDQSTILHDITKKTKYTQTNLLENHEQFMDRIAMLPNSFGRVDGKHNCTQTDVPLECMNCYDSTNDYVHRHSTQIDENSAPINSNVQIDEYGVNNFTPISSSAQIINKKIIPMDVEVYELKDSSDSDFNISNKSHYSSHFHPHPCNPASQNNNLIHSPINENNCNIFNDELNAYKPNEYTTINEAIPFIKKNNEVYIEFRKIVDKKIVNDRNCKILPFVRIAKNLKKNLKRQVADNKENRNHLLSGSIKKFKAEFIDRDFPCSDESNNNDNVDD